MMCPSVTARGVALAMAFGFLAACSTTPPPVPSAPATPVAPAFAAEPASQQCQDPAYRQLDFWLGTWVVTWQDPQTGQFQTGRNTVRSILGGCVIQEQFDGAALPLRGMSLSSYHRQKEEWRQLWVDNEGGYLPFGGGPEGDEFVLHLQRQRDTDPFRRMVWQDIKRNSLTWRWQSRPSASSPWNDVWVISYVREGR